VYGRRRRGAVVGAALVLLLAHAAFAGSSRSRSAPARHGLNDKDRADLSSVRWPLRGQAALVLGDGRPAASPHEQPVPIASLAKVMTAYLTLERYPLSGVQDGFKITVTEGQAQVEAHVTVGGHGLTAVGVVMGQGEGNDTSVILAAAGEAATQVVDSVAPAIPVSTIAAPAAAGGPGGGAGSHGHPLLLAPDRRSAQN